MEILDVQDQPDGSAILTFNMSDKENNFFVEYAIIDILREQIRNERSWQYVKDYIRTTVPD